MIGASAAWRARNAESQSPQHTVISAIWLSRTAHSRILRSVISSPSSKCRPSSSVTKPVAVGNAALQLKAPLRRVAVEEDVFGEHVVDLGSSEHLGESLAELLRRRVVGHGQFVRGHGCDGTDWSAGTHRAEY